MTATRRLLLALGSFLLVVTGGTAGYMLVSEARLLDALYMTVISVTTVGFGEIVPLDDAGRILTMVIVTLGLGSATFAVVTGIDFLVEGHLRDILGRRRMDRQLQRLHDHVIVCGYGRVGRSVSEQLLADRWPVVVVDPDPDRIAQAQQRRVLTVTDDASEDHTLIEAGVTRAKSLVACTADDADNVLVSLTAKGLNPGLFLVARAKDSENEPKMIRAGADRVIAPTTIGGRRIAALISRPIVVDFLDTVAHGTGIDLVLEELTVGVDSKLAQCTLRDVQFRERYGANVLAIRHGDGTMNTKPSPDDHLVPGDVLVVTGNRQNLDQLIAEGL